MTVLGTPLMGTDPKTWKWQQIAKVGTYRGHPSGPFELNSKVFDEIVANFKADDQPVQWDLQHASERENASELEGADARGWIHDLQNRGDRGLWALTEWSPEAAAKVDAGKFRFCSPAIVFKSLDRATGKPRGALLTSVALTGSPFLAGMQPLAAKTEIVATLMKAGMAKADAETEADKCLSSLPTTLSADDFIDEVEDMIEGVIERLEAKFHAGSAPTAPTPHTSQSPAEASPMSTPNEELIALTTRATKAEGEVTTLTAKVTKLEPLEGQVTTLTGKVTEMTARAEKAEGFIAGAAALLKLDVGQVGEQAIVNAVQKLLEDNATLLKAQTERSEADIVADVDRAFDDYEAPKKRDVAFKQTMLKHRRESPESFRAQYLPLTNEQRKLLTAVVPPMRRPDLKDPKSPLLLSHTALTAQLMREKGLGWTAAQDEATRLMREAAAAEQA